MGSVSDEKNQYIVMVPFMAQGHLIPFLALAKLIRRRTGFAVVIANSRLNINYLKSTTRSEDPAADSEIRFAELPFSAAEFGLPEGVENTDVLALSELDKLFHASTTLKSPFRDLISDLIAENDGAPPLCVVADVFTGWAVEVAREVGSSGVTFSTGGVYGTAAYVSIWLNLPHKSADSESFCVPGFPKRCRFEVSQLHQYLRAADGTDSWGRFMQTQISISMKSDGWLCNSVNEIEPLGVKILGDYLNLPIWTIGPFLPPEMLQPKKPSGSIPAIFRQRTAKSLGISAQKCLQWLDSHEPGSVLYISFGSQNTINPAQMIQLAAGLESTGKPFIWVIRPPLGFDIEGEFRLEFLPEGFEDRTAKRGLLVRNWAPQLEILAHRSTAAFLSHCGWNSVVESLSQGVPIIGWPMAGEQAYNMKMLEEELGMAVELARGLQSEVAAAEVKRVVEAVMDGGDEMKRKAGELGEKIRSALKDDGEEKGSSVKALDDFVNTITSSSRRI